MDVFFFFYNRGKRIELMARFYFDELYNLFCAARYFDGSLCLIEIDPLKLDDAIEIAWKEKENQEKYIRLEFM